MDYTQGQAGVSEGFLLILMDKNPFFVISGHNPATTGAFPGSDNGKIKEQVIAWKAPAFWCQGHAVFNKKLMDETHW